MAERILRFEDAIMLVQDGGKARRKCWAKIQDYTRATPPIQYERRWHIWMNDPGIIINGWGGQVGGDVGNSPVRDGGIYSPSDEDRLALDWEFMK